LYIAVAERTAWCQYTLRYIWYLANSSDSSADSPFSRSPTAGRPVAGSSTTTSALSSRSTSISPYGHAAHERVALQVLDLVEVERPRDEPAQRAVAGAAHERVDALGRVGRHPRAQHLGHGALGEQRTRDPLVVRHADLLERVRERIVPHVVQQRRRAHHPALVGAHPVERAALAEHGERGAGQVVGA
jgi:hypothetical protein